MLIRNQPGQITRETIFISKGVLSLKVLVVMPHYIPVSGPRHSVEGSSQDALTVRVQTVSNCIRQWNSLLNARSFLLGTDATIDPTPNALIDEQQADISGDVFVCINADNHLVQELKTVSFQTAQQSHGNPRYLGYFCRNVLLDLRNRYDLFIYVEDDTVPWDPLFLKKITSFYDNFGEGKLVLPNRYELFSGYSFKCYLECPSPEHYRLPPPESSLDALAMPDGAKFGVTDSPYAGFFAVTRDQLEVWATSPHFRKPAPDFEANFLEQAMIPMLGTRPIYRPSRSNMDYLEIHHLPDRACHAQTPWRKLVSLTGHEAAAGLSAIAPSA